jgi:hypothetical protein
VVAFLTALIITVGLTALAIPIAKRRPIGTPLSWGEAMLAATYAYGVMFLSYGVVPHQFLFWADNELKWRADRIVAGPGKVFDKLPFEFSYTTIRDIIVATIYILFLGAQIAIWGLWQNRGKKKAAQPAELTSTYGRPLARRT